METAIQSINAASVLRPPLITNFITKQADITVIRGYLHHRPKYVWKLFNEIHKQYPLHHGSHFLEFHGAAHSILPNIPQTEEHELGINSIYEIKQRMECDRGLQPIAYKTFSHNNLLDLISDDDLIKKMRGGYSYRGVMPLGKLLYSHENTQGRSSYIELEIKKIIY